MYCRPLFEVRYGTGFGCCSGLLVQFLWCELNLDPVQIKLLSLSLSLSDEVLPDPNVVSLHFSLPQNRSSWPPFLGLKILSMQPHNFPSSKTDHRFSHLFHSFNPKSWRAHGATDSAVASRRDSRDRWPHVRRKNHHPSSQNSIWEQQWQVCEPSLVLVTFFVCVIYMLEIYVGCG